VPGICVCHRACIYARTCALVYVHTRRRKGGERAEVVASHNGRAVLWQKVHCIYKSFIMNYTMVYLKWEACLVHGYMGYRDYNACGGAGGRERGERDPRLQEAAGPRAQPHGYRVGVRSRAYILPAFTHTPIVRAHASTNWYSRLHAGSRIKLGDRSYTCIY